jgi:hypothetical protein
MKLSELKQIIEEKKLTDLYDDCNGYPCFIFICEDNYFIAEQYVKCFADSKEKIIYYIDSLDGLSQKANTFEETNDYLYVLKLDKLDNSILNDANNLRILKNIIILCKAIDTNTKSEIEKIKYTHYIVSFPKLKDWWIKEYILSFCQGITQEQAENIYNINQGDIYSVYNQIAAIEIFDTAIQKEITDEIIQASTPFIYDTYNVYKISLDILKKDIYSLKQHLAIEHDKNSFLFISTFKKLIQNIITIQTDSRATADSLGISYNQFKLLQYNCNKYPTTTLINMFGFITTIDSKIKSGTILLEDDNLFDYIILTLSVYML